MTVAKLLNDHKHTIETVHDETPLGDVIKEFFDKKTSALLVTDQVGNMVGLVSERDVVKTMGQHGRAASDIPIKKVMSIDLVVCEPETSLQDALKMMAENKVRFLPIVNKSGHMYGIINVVEVARAMMEA
jgi:CBS domain-containing protein